MQQISACLRALYSLCKIKLRNSYQVEACFCHCVWGCVDKTQKSVSVQQLDLQICGDSDRPVKLCTNCYNSECVREGKEPGFYSLC